MTTTRGGGPHSRQELSPETVTIATMSALPEIDFEELRHWDSRRKPFPKRRIVLPFHRVFTPGEVARLRRGLLPREMEDHWVGILHEGTLDFSRSWTGNHIYRLHLRSGDGNLVTDEVIVNRELRQYRGKDPAMDVETLEELIEWMIRGWP